MAAIPPKAMKDHCFLRIILTTGAANSDTIRPSPKIPPLIQYSKKELCTLGIAEISGESAYHCFSSGL